MPKVLFAAAVVVFLLCVDAHAANNCNELTGTISGSMVFDNCSIPSGTLTIGSGSNIKFFNLSVTGANIIVQPLNVIIHILGGMLTAMSGNMFVVDTTSQVRNVTLHVKDVTARGTSSSAFSILSNNVQGVTITLEDCDIDVGTSSGSGSRRGIGAILPSSLTFTIEYVALTALRSVLVVRGSTAVAAMGVAVRDSSSGTGTITSLLAHVVDSDVQVLGSSSVSGVAISVRGWDSATVTLTHTNVTMAAHGSNVTTSGSNTLASLGIAVVGGGVTVSPTNLMMAAYGSNVTTSGSGWAVVSLSILSYCWGSGSRSTLTARDTHITAQLSHITATGPNAGIVVMGFGSFGHYSNFVPTIITDATLIACSSTIVSSEVAFDVVARFGRSGSPERFQQHRPASVANWSVTIIDSKVTTQYTGWTGNCLMALPNATHGSTAHSIIRDSVLNCSGLPATEPMAPDMLFTSNVTDRTGDEVAFIGANITGGPFEECPIVHHNLPLTPTPSTTVTSTLWRSHTRSRSRTLTLTRTRSWSGTASATSVRSSSSASGTGSRSRTASPSRRGATASPSPSPSPLLAASTSLTVSQSVAPSGGFVPAFSNTTAAPGSSASGTHTLTASSGAPGGEDGDGGGGGNGGIFLVFADITFDLTVAALVREFPGIREVLASAMGIPEGNVTLEAVFEGSAVGVMAISSALRSPAVQNLLSSETSNPDSELVSRYGAQGARVVSIDCSRACHAPGTAVTRLSADHERCECECRGQFTGDRCDVCPARFDGPGCDSCADGATGYPICGACAEPIRPQQPPLLTFSTMCTAVPEVATQLAEATATCDAAYCACLGGLPMDGDRGGSSDEVEAWPPAGCHVLFRPTACAAVLCAGVRRECLRAAQQAAIFPDACRRERQLLPMHYDNERAWCFFGLCSGAAAAAAAEGCDNEQLLYSSCAPDGGAGYTSAAGPPRSPSWCLFAFLAALVLVELLPRPQ